MTPLSSIELQTARTRPPSSPHQKMSRPLGRDVPPITRLRKTTPACAAVLSVARARLGWRSKRKRHADLYGRSFRLSSYGEHFCDSVGFEVSLLARIFPDSPVFAACLDV